jgi:uncharacterized membrane protein YgdD (TMEM256/DUF423 family)
MPTTDEPGRRTLIAGALLILVATAAGAFGTHALKPVLTEARFDSFQTAVSYQFFHALGLLAIGLLQRQHPGSALLRASARLILLGIALFAGSIYGITAGGPRALGMVAPLGGVSLMLAWLVFAVAVARLPRGVSSAS